MAGDWIKMRIDLQSHPKVVRILSATESDKFRVIGGLHAVWSVFDTHSEDGILSGYTPDALDHVIGWKGFSGAMLAVGWLESVDGDSLQMPEFTEHNGKSGKRRAEDQKRKRDARICPQSVRNLSAEDEDKKRTREEKRREDKENNKGDEYAADFAVFWAGYPNKANKSAAYKAWRKLKPSAPLTEKILYDVAGRDWKPPFIPHAATYLNGRRWEDEQDVPAVSGEVYR